MFVSHCVSSWLPRMLVMSVMRPLPCCLVDAFLECPKTTSFSPPPFLLLPPPPPCGTCLRPPSLHSTPLPLFCHSVSPGVKPAPSSLNRRPVQTGFQGKRCLSLMESWDRVMWRCDDDDVTLDQEDLESAFWIRIYKMVAMQYVHSGPHHPSGCHIRIYKRAVVDVRSSFCVSNDYYQVFIQESLRAPGLHWCQCCTVLVRFFCCVIGFPRNL